METIRKVSQLNRSSDSIFHTSDDFFANLTMLQLGIQSVHVQIVATVMIENDRIVMEMTLALK